MNRTQFFIYIAIGAVGLALILILVGVLAGRKPSAPRPAILEFWGIEDDEKIWRDVIDQFRLQNPHLTVNYRRFPQKTYEETLVNSLAEGRGPDVFVLKNSWIAKHREKIFPLPQDLFKFSARDFGRTFADITTEDLVDKESGQIFGLPIFVDTLAIFYNKDIFNSAGIAEPPKDWEEVKVLSRKLTKITPAGDITRSGIALGSSRNVEGFFEIVNALVLQNGDPIIRREAKDVELDAGGRKALEFYASFTDPRNRNFSWSPRAKNSLDAFAEGEAAMILGFSADIPKLLAKNPHLAMSVAPFPKEREARVHLTYGSYFFPTVSKFSRNPEEAWEFIFFITSKDAAKMYLEKSKRPPARRDLISEGPLADELEVFYKQALIAKSWFVPDERAARNLFMDAVESVITRTATSERAISKLKEQLRLLMP